MEEKERVVLRSGLVLELEDFSEDFEFHAAGNGGEEVVTWGELKRQIIEMFERHAERLLSKGYKRVEVGSVQWFWSRGVRKGRFVPLNTMFLARLLKR